VARIGSLIDASSLTLMLRLILPQAAAQGRRPLAAQPMLAFLGYPG
jgi:hypothetical protein